MPEDKKHVHTETRHVTITYDVKVKADATSKMSGTEDERIERVLRRLIRRGGGR